MQKHIEHYVTKACTRIKQKTPSRETRAPLVSIVTTQPFDLVSIDCLHLDKCPGGYEYLLVIVDHFTRFTQAFPTTSKSAKMVADRIFNDYALKFGLPARIHHDQGGEFENQLFAQLRRKYGASGSRTTPYHLQVNGQLERFNRPLLQMLKTLTEKDKSNWKASLNKLLYPGDRVLVRNLTPRGGTGKLRNHWEDGVQVVVRQMGEGIPVYEVKPEQGRGLRVIKCGNIPHDSHG